jgi:hypothetical protein
MRTRSKAWGVRRARGACIGASACANVFAFACAGALQACGDDTAIAPADAGPDASIAVDGEGYEAGEFDGNLASEGGLGTGDAPAPPPPRLLLTYGTAAQSELDVFGLESAAVDGRLAFSSAPATLAATASSPWLLEGASDVVLRLDALQPWIVRASWSVALADAPDAGGAPRDAGDAGDGGASEGPADPVGLVVGPGTDAYVLRRGRNALAVVDTSQDVDGGVPAKTVDLSSAAQAGGDGWVRPTAAYFEPVRQLVYVLLAHGDGASATPGGPPPCSATRPSIVAVDPAHAALAPLGGGGDGGGSAYELRGDAPPVGPSSMVYDPAGDRLLVLQGGCLAAGAIDGGPTLVRRGVDAVSLADGAVTSLLDLTTLPAAPLALFYLDAQHAIVQVEGAAYAWDPTTSSLGAAIAGAPAAFTVDGEGNLVGVAATPGDAGAGGDGAASGWSVVSVPSTDGGAATLGGDPFALSGGSPAGVALWPGN